ncbi:AEC family transporter [Acetobacter sp. DsW_063]|uniref:AEC family transporter n=1 Tax=Acetobacter sp. DsW_063 TaxID=1514894 RepID=UPI000A3B9312|nr:AEC family transporter [Acetobacter sp. DsW_063]OUJ09955.1 hypothetical protein HK28_06510 [Acetobacter sp. DsW_063]
MTIFGVISVLAPIFGLIVFGAITAKQNWLGADATNVLNRFVIRLALPAELFKITCDVPLAELNHVGFAGAFGLGMVLTFGLNWLVRWRRDEGRPHRLSNAAIEGLSAGYANTSFIGIPVCLDVFGEQSKAAITISTLLTACSLFAIAIFMIEFDEQAGGRTGAVMRRVSRALALNPLIFMPFLGLVVNITGLSIPSAGTTFVTLLAGAASPCALLTIGMFLVESRKASTAPLFGTLRLAGMKLLVQPALTFLLAVTVFSEQPVWSREALVLSALPTGTGPFMLAKLYGREAGVASQVTLLTTIASVITLSIILVWLS